LISWSSFEAGTLGCEHRPLRLSMSGHVAMLWSNSIKRKHLKCGLLGLASPPRV
jgi:hypothetical protein